MNMASTFYLSAAPLHQRMVVTTIVVALHLAVFAAWQMQPTQAATTPHEMKISVALMMAPAAVQAEALPPQQLPTFPIEQSVLPEKLPENQVENPIEAPAMLRVAPAAVAAAMPSTPSIAVTEARFDADYLQNPAPLYPLLSRKLAEEGKVLLQVEVSAMGTASHVQIKQGSGYPRLDQAALNTVRLWRFIPARHGDKAVSAQVVVPIVFRLDS